MPPHCSHYMFIPYVPIQELRSVLEPCLTVIAISGNSPNMDQSSCIETFEISTEPA